MWVSAVFASCQAVAGSPRSAAEYERYVRVQEGAVGGGLGRREGVVPPAVCALDVAAVEGEPAGQGGAASARRGQRLTQGAAAGAGQDRGDVVEVCGHLGCEQAGRLGVFEFEEVGGVRADQADRALVRVAGSGQGVAQAVALGAGLRQSAHDRAAGEDLRGGVQDGRHRDRGRTLETQLLVGDPGHRLQGPAIVGTDGAVRSALPFLDESLRTVIRFAEARAGMTDRHGELALAQPHGHPGCAQLLIRKRS